MGGWTNKGKFEVLGYVWRGTTLPTTFYVALCTSATTPVADTNTFSQLTEIAGGNGYTAGGIGLSPGVTDFDVHTEDDSGDKGYVQLKDIIWTASTGPIPASGNGARWAILTDNNATQGSRIVILYWDLSSDRSVSDGQSITLQNCQMDLREA